MQDGENILFYAEIAEHRGFLGKITDAEHGALMHRQVTNGFAVEPDFARIVTNQADQHVEAGRLARAIGPKQANDFTTGNMQ